MIVFGEAHLRRILGEYVAYYNKSRIHSALNKDAPFPRAVERLGGITSRPVLGSLLTNIAESDFRYTQGLIAPCLPTSALQPPCGAEWPHEIKHDGFRVIARRDGKGRSRHWIKSKNPHAPAVRREAEEDWGR